LREVGGGQVRRLLPAARQRSVGPFVFFDHFGPEEVAAFEDRDVRPHPHIGLSTVTYLWDGEIVHRDSIGSIQPIEPGAINWMTAGRGIAHSERTPPGLAGRRRRVHGLQLWTALPRAMEEKDPSFAHTPAASIPAQKHGDVEVRTLVGRAWGVESPVVPSSETLYLDIALPASGRIDIPALAAERAIYGLDAPFELEGTRMDAFTMAILEAGTTATLSSEAPARVVVIGGAPLDGPRFMWWNYVSSRRDLIIEAARQWQQDHTPQIPGETEWIDLPGAPPFDFSQK
jgi:redox-sensitive bicupin YhaK (pirin superfamily)